MKNEQSAEDRASGLGTRVLSGLIWTKLGQGAQILFQLVAIVALARLLDPRDFGVFAIGMIILGITESAFYLCLDQSVVQRKGSLEGRVDIAWTGNLLGMIVGILVLVPLTPLVTVYVFDAPEATAVTWLMLVCLLCIPLRSPGLMLLHRQIDLQRFFYLQLAFSAVRYLGAIALAIWLRNFWALAIALVAGRIVEVVLSYCLVRYRPRLVFSRETFFELYRFASWLQANSILKNLARHLDSVLVGSLMGTSDLGLYNRAWTIAAVPLQGIETIVHRVFFPMFSAVQDAREKTEKLAKQANDYCLILFAPIVVAFFVAGGPIVTLVLGEKWLPTAMAIPALLIGFALRSINLSLNSLLRANGLSRVAFLLSLVPIGVVAVAVVPLIQLYGIMGAGISISLGAVAGLLCTQWVLRSRLNISAECWLPSLSTCTVAAVTAIASANWLSANAPNLANSAIAQLAIALGMMAGVLFLLQLALRVGPFDTVFRGLGRLKAMQSGK